jgi:hypothetical protein
MDRLQRDCDWYITDEQGNIPSIYGPGYGQLAVLQDIRAQLYKLNTLLHCHNAVDIPNILREIRTNTTKPKKSKKPKRKSNAK